MIPRGSLRFRMMALFCVVVGILLGGSYLAFYIMLKQEVQAQLDRQLIETSTPVVTDIQGDQSESDVSDLNIPEEYFEVVDTSGRVIVHSRNLASQFLPLPAVPASLSHIFFETIRDAVRGRLRIILIPFAYRAGKHIFVLAIPTRSADQNLRTFRNLICILFPLSLFVTGMVSTWYVGRSLRPVAKLTQQAKGMIGRVADGKRCELWQAPAVSSPQDELGQLAETFGTLFAKLDSAMQEMRQFVSDASHELRTPLSVLRGETELMLTEPRSVNEYQTALRSIEDELKKLSRIVEGLFTLAMADAGQLRLARDPLYLNEVLEESCAMVAPLARKKDITIQRELSGEVFDVGDEIFLRQLFVIFLDNAVKYSPPHSRVYVGLEICKGIARATFEDEGTGISAEHLPHIYERFYRGSSHNSEEVQSGGLGLAIAQAIVRAEGGSIDCQTAPGKGTTFTISLPLRVSPPIPTSQG